MKIFFGSSSRIYGKKYEEMIDELNNLKFEVSGLQYLITKMENKENKEVLEK